MLATYLLGKTNNDGKKHSVFVEIRVEAGCVPSEEDVRKAANAARKRAIKQLKHQREPIPVRPEQLSNGEDQWMCECGHEGRLLQDGGICPVCNGYGQSDNNG